MNDHYTISLFTNEWWLVNIASFSTIFVIVLFGIKVDSKKKEFISKLISFALIMRFLLVQYYHLFILENWDNVVNLPLHLCGISSILSGVTLLYRKQFLYELLLYWGFAGAFHSFFTPEFTTGHEGILYVDYFISHGGIFLSIFYLTFVLKMRPSKKSWIKIFIFSQILIPTIGFFNFIFDSNYMFLRQAPIVDNPLILTRQWPWYILVIDFIALLHFYIIYLIFKLKNN